MCGVDPGGLLDHEYQTTPLISRAQVRQTGTYCVGQQVSDDSVEDTIQECELLPLFQDSQGMVGLVTTLTSGGPALSDKIEHHP